MQTTLESNYWIGAQGNRLWVGQIEGDGNVDIAGEELVDFSANNRVKVRIMGYHNRNRKELPPKDLPWASCMMPTTSPTTRAAGEIHGLDVGAWVLGTFLDGESAQQPIVLGSLGITEKGKTYSERLDDLGLSNNYVERRPETADNNKPNRGQEVNGVPKRGQNAGRASNNDKQQEETEKVSFSVANGKCNKRPESEFGRILNDLFRFVRQNDRLGDVFVNKTTGNITNALETVQTYVSRLASVANGMLGDIKQLILNEVKLWFQKLIITPIITALALKPEKDSKTIWATSEVMEQVWEIIKCLFSTVLEKLLNFLLDLVLGIIDDLINAAFCVISDIINSIVGQISELIENALGMIQNALSIIQSKGNWAGSLIAQIGALIESFCDGGLSCILGTGEYVTKEGNIPDNSIEKLFNRVETFGGLSNELNVGLYGDDSFFSTFANTQIIGSDGKVARGTLDCSKANRTLIPAFPNVYFTGGPSKGKPAAGFPVVNTYGEVVSVVITDPGSDINRVPSLTISPYAGYGSNATGDVIIEDGQVVDVVITNPGGGYPYFDGSVSNTTVPLDENGDPLYDQIYGASTDNSIWLGIITASNPPIVTNTGDGLDESCTLIVEPGKREVNEVVLPVLKPNIVDGRLLSITVVKEGFGFTALPKIYLACENVGPSKSRKSRILPRIKFIPRKDANKYLNEYDTYATIIDCVGHPGE
jgi:hypothetical protein